MKLLQIAKHFRPDTGGIETVTEGISEMLPAQGIQADVLCTGTGRAYAERDLPYRVIRCAPGLPLGGNKSLSPGYVGQVARLSPAYDVGLVHLPNPVAVAAVLAFWRKPYIAIWHADIPQRRIRELTARMDRRFIAGAAAVVAATPVHIEESFHADAIAGKGAIIGFPLDRRNMPAPTGQSDVARRVAAFARGRPIVLAVGRLVPYKGFDVLIEAARRFGDDLVAVIVGEGPLREELAGQIEAKGVADRVLMTGSVDDAALADLFAAMHIGCLPSVTAAEMYGLVQVEAFSFGKPMVSTRLARSGVPYVNRDGETGLLVTPGDAEELASALRRLAEDDALHASLARGAAESYALRHETSVVGRQYAELIRRAVGG